jgi:hypothetical protein
MTQAKFGGDKNDIVSAIAGSNRNSGQTVHASHTRADGLGALRPLARRPHIRWTSLAWRGYCPVGLGRLEDLRLEDDCAAAPSLDMSSSSPKFFFGVFMMAVVLAFLATWFGSIRDPIDAVRGGLIYKF